MRNARAGNAGCKLSVPRPSTRSRKSARGAKRGPDAQANPPRGRPWAGPTHPPGPPYLGIKDATNHTEQNANQPHHAASRDSNTVILPKGRDTRFITIRRGGTLTDSDHRLLALWAAACAEHVLHLFEWARPSDPRPREAIEQIRAWACGEIRMSQSRAAGGHAMAAARELSGAARHAAYAAGQAAAVAHVAAHELGAAAYAIKAVREATPGREGETAGRLECRWQREQLPDVIRELVVEDQRLRNEICWSVFGC
jgi:hypothetical protein